MTLFTCGICHKSVINEWFISCSKSCSARTSRDILSLKTRRDVMRKKMLAILVLDFLSEVLIKVTYGVSNFNFKSTLS